MTVSKKVTTNESTSILAKVYNYDRSSAYSNNGNTVHGSVITATFKDNILEITSNVLFESTLQAFFNKAQ